MNLWIRNSKLVKQRHENLLCSYLPQPHELRLWSLGSGGIYGSYGAAVTGFPAGIKIDPGWGLYPINPGLLPLEVQNCLKNFYRDVKMEELELLPSTHLLGMKSFRYYSFVSIDIVGSVSSHIGIRDWRNFLCFE